MNPVYFLSWNNKWPQRVNQIEDLRSCICRGFSVENSSCGMSQRCIPGCRRVKVPSLFPSCSQMDKAKEVGQLWSGMDKINRTIFLLWTPVSPTYVMPKELLYPTGALYPNPSANGTCFCLWMEILTPAASIMGRMSTCSCWIRSWSPEKQRFSKTKDFNFVEP